MGGRTKNGYSLSAVHPVTGGALAGHSASAAGSVGGDQPAGRRRNVCLINLYRGRRKKMGVCTRIATRKRLPAPAVIGVSAGGLRPLFRIGRSGLRGGQDSQRHPWPPGRRDRFWRAVAAGWLYHGIDRIKPGSSRLLPRRAAPPQPDLAEGGHGDCAPAGARRLRLSASRRPKKKKNPRPGRPGANALQMRRGSNREGDDRRTPAKTGS